MLYAPETATLVQTVIPGGLPPEAELVRLAGLKGKTLEDGRYVAQVALVFVFGSADAEPHLPLLRRLGLEVCAIDDGVEKVLFTGQAVLPGTAHPDGPLLPVLREEGWPHAGEVVHRRLLSGPARSGPWVTFAIDLGQSLARMPASELQTRSLPDIEAEALANLAKQPVEVKKLGPGVVAVFGEYGSEAVLLPDVLRRVAAELGAELVAIGVPKEGGFMAHDASDLGKVGALVQWSRDQFDQAKSRRVSPLPLLARDGELVGFAAQSPGGTAETEPSPAKPWWRFW